MSDATAQKISDKLVARLAELTRRETALYAAGEKRLAGVDEAGRGPLAGPVVAGAVILPEGFSVYGVDDSKKLSPKKRGELYEKLVETAEAWHIGIVSEAEIDGINILQATYKAMRLALAGLKPPPERVLVDGYAIPMLGIPQTPLVHGDSLSVSIAAASILAKVTRDRLMAEYDKIYPEYGFAAHKGYGTAAHIRAIKKYGLCPIHRRSFAKKFEDSERYEG